MTSFHEIIKNFNRSIVEPVLHVDSSCVGPLRVQMSDLSSVQTTSFHTRLTFLDEDSDELFEDVEEEDEEFRPCDLPEGPLETVLVFLFVESTLICLFLFRGLQRRV